jgi:NAD(P)-dependent dehydrogenase (short-subunit alcohol dehydrogenase family)
MNPAPDNSATPTILIVGASRGSGYAITAEFRVQIING